MPGVGWLTGRWLSISDGAPSGGEKKIRKISLLLSYTKVETHKVDY